MLSKEPASTSSSLLLPQRRCTGLEKAVTVPLLLATCSCRPQKCELRLWSGYAFIDMVLLLASAYLVLGALRKAEVPGVEHLNIFLRCLRLGHREVQAIDWCLCQCS